jgi:two-component system phosphate regulon sensor histidine kinase PhoR
MSPAAGPAPLPPPPADLSLLVVDDEEGMREGMRRVLERKGYRVVTAGDGSEAIERLSQRAFDIALVDLKMPGVDGFEVTKRINEGFGGRTVVVIVSALATVEAAVQVSRHGAFDFLVKPFAPGDLLDVVERAARQCGLLQERETYLSALNSERTLSRQLINSMREGLVVLNINRKPVLMNPRAELLLGTGYREDMSLEDLGLGPEGAAAVQELMAEGPADGRFRRLHREAGGRVLQVHLAPYIRGDEPSGLILLVQDVTDEWQAERNRNRFVSMVAHEITSPLAAIVGYIDVVLSGALDGDPQRLKEVMGRSKARAEGLLELARDLQFLARSEARKVERSSRRLELREVLRGQLEFFALEAARRGVSLTLESPDEAPCYADRGDLERIFGNLISNGIKYNREGGRLLVSVRRGRSGSGCGWEVSFEDTGIGMAAAEVSGLFQDFYRVRSPRTEGIPGTGLGLATVRRVLDEYNGTISVESTPDVGSRFVVALPCVEPDARPR